MKLSKTYSEYLTESAKKLRYDMKNVNGGFSNGVDISVGKTSDVMRVEVNIYGGSRSEAHTYQVPPPIKELQDGFLAAKQLGDPVGADLKRELKAYYNNLEQAISLEMINLIKKFDADAKAVIDAAVQRMNAKYQQ